MICKKNLPCIVVHSSKSESALYQGHSRSVLVCTKKALRQNIADYIILKIYSVSVEQISVTLL